ncbi:hypothetical protein LTS10_003215 [Elasticomyces elasticus]|nr:hypothetical protein LTS10_003215 [Elasticomyces elasticus]
MDFTALFHALLLILSIPNKALNSLNSLLNAYPRTIGPPPPPPVITAIAYRYLPAVSTAYTFEAHGTTSPTYAAVTGQLDNAMPTSYNLADAVFVSRQRNELRHTRDLVTYEKASAGHIRPLTIEFNAVYLLLIVIGLFAVLMGPVLLYDVLRKRSMVLKEVYRLWQQDHDILTKEKLTALTTISRADKEHQAVCDGFQRRVHKLLHERSKLDLHATSQEHLAARLAADVARRDSTLSGTEKALGVANTALEGAHVRITGLEEQIKQRKQEVSSLKKTEKEKSKALEEAEKSVKELRGKLATNSRTTDLRFNKIKTVEAAQVAAANDRDAAITAERSLKDLLDRYEKQELECRQKVERAENAQQATEIARYATDTARDAAVTAQKAAEISFKDLQDKFKEQAQAHRKEIQSTEAAQKDAQRGRDAAVDESRVAMAAVAAAEEARKAAEAGCQDFQDISTAQADEFDRSRKKYEMRATDFVEMESIATKQSVKIEELEEVIERLKYDAARRPETTQKCLTKALSLTARRTEAQVGELTVTVNDLQDACNSFAILLNDTLSKCEPIESRDVKERYDELMHQFQQRRNVSAAHQAPWDVLQGRHTVETATPTPNDLTSDGDGFAQTIATFSVDDSPTLTVAHSPCGVPVAVRLPPPAPPKVEADAGAMCSGVKSDDDGQVSDQCYDRDGETSSNGGESGYVSGSQWSSGSADTVSHHAPAESEQHETQVDSGGEASIATLRDPSLAALELRQESVLYSADTTYDNASASSEQRGDRVHGDGEVSIATSRDPSPASVEASLARTETTAEPGASDLGDECGSSDGFAASQITDTELDVKNTELDVKKKKNRRSRRAGTGRLHETIEEGNARRAGLVKPLRRGGHNQRSRGLKSANMW